MGLAAKVQSFLESAMTDYTEQLHYTNPTMPYRNAPISIEDGAWIGAQTTVCPGVTVHRNAILTVGSVATKEMAANGIYQGNPAVKIRERKFKN